MKQELTHRPRHRPEELQEPISFTSDMTWTGGAAGPIFIHVGYDIDQRSCRSPFSITLDRRTLKQEQVQLGTQMLIEAYESPVGSWLFGVEVGYWVRRRLQRHEYHLLGVGCWMPRLLGGGVGYRARRLAFWCPDTFEELAIGHGGWLLGAQTPLRSWLSGTVVGYWVPRHL